MKYFLKSDLREAEKRGDLDEVYRLLRAIQDLEVKRVTTPAPWTKPRDQARVQAYRELDPVEGN